jgi:hypothetical protein
MCQLLSPPYEVSDCPTPRFTGHFTRAPGQILSRQGRFSCENYGKGEWGARRLHDRLLQRVPAPQRGHCLGLSPVGREFPNIDLEPDVEGLQTSNSPTHPKDREMSSNSGVFKGGLRTFPASVAALALLTLFAAPCLAQVGPTFHQPIHIPSPPPIPSIPQTVHIPSPPQITHVPVHNHVEQMRQINQQARLDMQHHQMSQQMHQNHIRAMEQARTIQDNLSRMQQEAQSAATQAMIQRHLEQVQGQISRHQQQQQTLRDTQSSYSLGGGGSSMPAAGPYVNPFYSTQAQRYALWLQMQQAQQRSPWARYQLNLARGQLNLMRAAQRQARWYGW